MIRILSLGAGVQSSTLALMAEHGEIEKFDCAIFADTQCEPKSVYTWLEWLKTKLSYPVYIVSKGSLSDASLKVRLSKKGNYYQQSAPPAWIIDDKGKCGLLMRQCTVDFKIRPIVKKIKELNKKQNVIQSLGISLDEIHRMKPSREKLITNNWPLIEKRMTRFDCINWMKKNNYPKPPRSICYFCPYHSDKEWLRLKEEESEEFQKAIEYETELQKTMSQIKNFRGKVFLHKSCKNLSDIDFNIESNQMNLFNSECDGVCGL